MSRLSSLRQLLARNKHDALAIFLLAAFPFFLYWQAALRQAVFSFGDIFLFFYPTHLAYANALRGFRLPLWEPNILFGFPLYAEGQIGALYPTHPFLYGLLPIDIATNYDILIHLLWVAVGMYAFLRVIALRPAAAFLGAFAFGMSAFFIARLQHMSVIATAAWLPWLMWGWEKYERATNRKSRLRWFALLALFSGIQLLGGHPQFAFLSAILLAAYSIVRWKRGESAPPQRNLFFRYFDLSRLTPVVLFFLIGLAFAAVQLVPMFELSGFSNRATGLLPKFFNAFSLRLPHYLMLFHPFLLGNPYPNVSVEVIGYVGMLPLLLAIGAPLLQRDRRVVFFGMIALAALFLGLGDLNPVYRALRYLPLFNYFRVPSRFFFWFAFAATVLAAIAFDGLIARARESLRLTRAQKTILLVLVLIIATLVGAMPQVPLDAWLAAWAWLPLALALIGAWILLGARRGLFARATLVTLAIGVTMIDMIFFAAVYAKTYDEMSPLEEFHARPRSLSVLKNVSPSDGRILTSLWIYPVPSTMRESLYPNTSMMYGVPSGIGYTPLIPQRTSDYLENINAPMLNLGNIRYYLMPQMLPVNPKDEGEDLHNQFAPEFIGQYIGFPRTSAARLKIRSSLGQSVNWSDGEPVARIGLTAEDGEWYFFSLRAGLDTAEWAYERTDVRKDIRHAMPPIATSFPALSAFPVEQHSGHTYLAEFDVTRNGQPRAIAGIFIFPLVHPGLIHIEQIYFVSPEGSETSLAQLIGRGDHRLIFRSQHVAVFENPDALPRAFLVHDARAASDGAALKEMSDDTFTPRETLLLADGAPMREGGAQRADEQVQITEYKPERVTLSVHASAPGYLLLADAWHPGWVARVDGVETPIRRADLIFRAVPVSAGTHQIEFEYKPMSLYIGAAVSALAALIVIGIFVASRRI
jgi:hypothetical protein